MLIEVEVKGSDRLLLKAPLLKGGWGDLHLDYPKKIPPSPP
jgi:hypothetical protein